MCRRLGGRRCRRRRSRRLGGLGGLGGRRRCHRRSGHRGRRRGRRRRRRSSGRRRRRRGRSSGRRSHRFGRLRWLFLCTRRHSTTDRANEQRSRQRGCAQGSSATLLSQAAQRGHHHQVQVIGQRP
ncbi:MAG TPA: hypothetical protein DEG13_12540 [Candidatus Microthrix parvicella]|nr:hypothetical protein [Candidatus Microthrix parvicella]